MSRQVIELASPRPAGDDCLPHAAMNLGSSGGSSLRPARPMVHRLVLEEQYGQWVLYRLDDGGGFVGDSWHGSREDAVGQIRREFGIAVE